MTLLGVEDQPGVAAGIFGPLADANINVDMIVQNASEDGTTDVTFHNQPRGPGSRPEGCKRQYESSISDN